MYLVYALAGLDSMVFAAGLMMVMLLGTVFMAMFGGEELNQAWYLLPVALFFGGPVVFWWVLPRRRRRGGR
jgi:Na+/melibiose symporter-like transporter